MPPRMKAREIAIEQFGSFKDDDGSDAEMCFGALEYFLEWLIQQGWSKAPQQAPAPLSDDVVKDAARYRWLREHEGADGLIRSDCRGLYLPQRDALDSAIDALLFTTPSQRAVLATWGKPQPVVREPLHAVDLMRIVLKIEQEHHFLRGTSNWAVSVGRAIERAHGITQKGGSNAE